MNRRWLPSLTYAVVVPVQPEGMTGLANLPVLVVPAHDGEKAGKLPAFAIRSESIASDPVHFVVGLSSDKVLIHSDPTEVVWRAARIDTPLFSEEFGK